MQIVHEHVTLVGGINKTLRVANYIIRLHVAYVGNTYSHIPNDLPEGPIFIFTGEPTQWAGYCSFTLHRAVNEPRPGPIRSPPKQANCPSLLRRLTLAARRSHGAVALGRALWWTTGTTNARGAGYRPLLQPDRGARRRDGRVCLS